MSGSIRSRTEGALLAAAVLLCAGASSPARAQQDPLGVVPGAENPCRPARGDSRSASEVWVARLWDFYNAGRYPELIAGYTLCLGEFLPAADRMQDATLTAPELGKVPRERWAAIFINGPLNDVGTALWLVARSREKLGHRQEAGAAYTACKKYTHARTLDPAQELFWAPARDCEDRLQVMR